MNKFKKIIKSFFIYAIIVMFSLFFIFPIFWTIVVSLKKPLDTFTLSVIPFLQFEPTLDNWYNEVVKAFSENAQALTNSTIVGLGSAFLTTIMGSLAGYSLARYEFKRIRNIDILSWFLSLRFLPPIALAIPYYILMQNFKLLDTPIALILAHTVAFIPYSVLVSRDAFKSLPMAMEEAALIDGCSILGVLFRIALPLVAPALSAIFILTFTFSWNEFLFAFVLTSKNALTMPVRLAGSVTTVGVLFYVISVRALLAIMPPILLGIIVQKYIVKGLTLGAIKG